MFLSLRTLFACALLVSSALAWGSISIGGGGVVSLGGGTIDLGGSDLVVDGQLDVTDGQLLDAGDVVINGALDGGTGLITLRGDWVRNGAFAANLGEVAMLDDDGGSANLVGDSEFHDLSLVSSAGGAFVLQSGTTQRILNALVIQGLGGLPVQIESSDPPAIAQIYLDPLGTQDIDFVGVSNVYAIGQHLAPDQTNQGGSGNDFGWFGNELLPQVIPTLSIPGLLALILILAMIGIGRARARRSV